MPADSGTVAYLDEPTTQCVRRTYIGPSAPERRHGRAWLVAKRLLDLAIALLLLLLLAPLLTVIALAVRLDSPGPALFRQTRLGRDLRRFPVLKFRTMFHGVSHEVHRQYIARLMTGDAEDAGLKKLTQDPRVTRIGAFLRRTSLDELPQLLNVIAGHMSLVGPRPALEYELEHYEPEHFTRFFVRPGLTGLWQVSGRNEVGFREMLELDSRYATENGPVMDAEILARTPVTLLSRRAA